MAKEKKEQKVEAKGQKQEQKKSRLAEAFSRDYKYEGIILLILATIAIVLGILILKGEGIFASLQISADAGGVFLIGGSPNYIIFAITLIVLGAASLLLSIWPYYKPSIDELKRVTWPTRKKIITNGFYVLVYATSFAVFFFLCDLLFNRLISLL